MSDSTQAIEETDISDEPGAYRLTVERDASGAIAVVEQWHGLEGVSVEFSPSEWDRARTLMGTPSARGIIEAALRKVDELRRTDSTHWTGRDCELLDAADALDPSTLSPNADAPTQATDSLFKCAKCGGATIKVSHRNHPFCTVCARCPCAGCEKKDKGSARGMNEACAKVADSFDCKNPSCNSAACRVAPKIAAEIRALSPNADAGAVTREEVASKELRDLLVEKLRGDGDCCETPDEDGYGCNSDESAKPRAEWCDWCEWADRAQKAIDRFDAAKKGGQ